MARFYTNENIPLQVVAELRQLGHDVLTSLDAGRANESVPDSEVLAFAAEANRILLSIATKRQIMPASFFVLSIRTSAGRLSVFMRSLPPPLEC